MLTDVKTWLETTGMKATEDCFFKPPPPPYIVFTDKPHYLGADNENLIADRALSIELYSQRINKESESKIENLLNERAIEFTKERTWIQEELFFQTVYDFNLIEKI